MSKVAIVYWSGTGNTEAMANAVAEGAKAQGAEATPVSAGEFDAALMDNFDAVAFGCPAMGAEVLEEGEFEPMFSACEAKLAGKKDRPVRLLRLGRRRMDAQLGRNLRGGRRGPRLRKRHLPGNPGRRRADGLQGAGRGAGVIRFSKEEKEAQ